LERHGGLDRDARQLLVAGAGRLQLSARAFHRVLRVARTVADLDGETAVRAPHVAEAMGYRPRNDDSARLAVVTEGAQEETTLANVKVSA
jgi:predicted ATPase with chaperone activity